MISYQKIRTFIAIVAINLFIFGSYSYAGLPALSEKQNFLHEFVVFEQIINDKVENTKEFASIINHQVPTPYRPESANNFKLKTYLVPVDKLIILNTNKSIADISKILVKNDSGTFIKFFVHPLSVEVFNPYLKNYTYDENVLATPLSSFRSILAWDNSESDNTKHIMNLKVSLNAEIGQSLRMLSRGQIERATIMSYAIKGMDLNL